MAQIVIHHQNGNENDAKFVEIDGQKFEADDVDATKPKLDDKGNKVPFKPEGKKEGTSNNKTLEELAKESPEVARLLKEKQDLEADRQKREAEERKRKEEDAKAKGDWQKMYEEEAAKNTKLNDELTKKETILGKYVGSVKGMLEQMLKDIPKENLGLIPDSFSPREKVEYITKNAKLLGLKAGIGSKGARVENNDANPNATDEDKIISEMAELQKKSAKTNADHTKLWELAKKLKEIRAKK